jgi:predicted amidophosphoribosyltransferase
MALAATSGGRDARVVASLRMKPMVRDSVGLSGAARQRNVAGRVRLSGSANQLSGDVLVVDDIVTTGATAAESVRVLQTSGARVIAVLALANA